MLLSTPPPPDSSISPEMVERDISDSEPVPLLVMEVVGVASGSAGVVVSVDGGGVEKDGLSDRALGGLVVLGPRGGVLALLEDRERWRLASRSFWEEEVRSSSPPEVRPLMARAGAGLRGMGVGVRAESIKASTGTGTKGDGEWLENEFGTQVGEETINGSGAWTTDAQGRAGGCSKAEVGASTSRGWDGALPAGRSKGEGPGGPAQSDPIGVKSSRAATDQGQSSLPLLPCVGSGGMGVGVCDEVETPGVGSGPRGAEQARGTKDEALVAESMVI